VFKKVEREVNRQKKKLKIRARIKGTAEKPRMAVYRSLTNVFVQLIDDVNGVTLASASTIDKEIKPTVKSGGNMEAAALIGKKLAERATAKGIKTVVFDRAGYLYTGRVKALADAAREAGLEF
jgi:large subunit ribosomal protein L18